MILARRGRLKPRLLLYGTETQEPGQLFGIGVEADEAKLAVGG